MTLHRFALESILAVCHKSNDSNPDEIFGRDRALLRTVPAAVSVLTDAFGRAGYSRPANGALDRHLKSSPVPPGSSNV